MEGLGAQSVPKGDRRAPQSHESIRAEEEDSIGSEPEPDPPDDEDGDGDGDGASSSKKRSSSKRKLFTYYRKIANPSKIIGE